MRAGGGWEVDIKSHEGFGGQQIMKVWVGFWWTTSHMRFWVDSKSWGCGLGFGGQQVTWGFGQTARHEGLSWVLVDSFHEGMGGVLVGQWIMMMDYGGQCWLKGCGRHHIMRGCGGQVITACHGDYTRGCGGQRVMMVDSTQKTNDGLWWTVHNDGLRWTVHNDGLWWTVHNDGFAVDST